MISNQVIQNSIEELKAITKIDFAVFGLQGEVIGSTFDAAEVEKEMLGTFLDSPADSQVIGVHHLLKIMDDGEVQYILDARGLGDDAYMMGKVCTCQLQNLMIAYKERFDRTAFFQNLILDNMLLVDIYNGAKKLHVEDQQPRCVFLIESLKTETDDLVLKELMSSMFLTQNGDFLLSVDENSLILLKNMEEDNSHEAQEKVAKTIVDMVGAEIMMNVRVAYGGCVKELKDVSKSYKEAKMAAEVGSIFYEEKKIIAYHQLGIGRLIYQLPINLCKMFIDEIFGGELPEELDEETLSTVNMFFENNLNVSETARNLYIHRNTLVYRMEKLQKATGLDVRVFEDALTLKIALMVVNYMKHLETE